MTEVLAAPLFQPLPSGVRESEYCFRGESGADYDIVRVTKKGKPLEITTSQIYENLNLAEEEIRSHFKGTRWEKVDIVLPDSEMEKHRGETIERIVDRRFRYQK